MKRIIAPLLLLVLVFALAGFQETKTSRDKTGLPDMKGWPVASQLAARDMFQKYGEPDEVTENMIMWKNNGPWKRTKIVNKETPHSFPVEHTDVMEQTINYNVPVEKFSALAEYDGSVTAKRTDGELSAKCDKEGANFLAINLAYDIINGKKTVKEAREFYATTIKEYVLNNKKSPYMESLQFNPSADMKGDKDRLGVSEEENNQITKKIEEMNKAMMEKEMGMK